VLQRFPLETNVVKFPVTLVSRKTFSNYSSLVSPLFFNTMEVERANFSKDMGKAVLVCPSPIDRHGTLVYFDRDSGTLQAFNKIEVPVNWAVISEKGDRVFFAATPREGERRIYAAIFSNFAVDPVHQMKLVVDRVARADWPSITPSGNRFAYQSDHKGHTKVFVCDLGDDGRSTNEFEIGGSFGNSYRPKLSATGTRALYLQHVPDGYQLVYADLKARICYPVWGKMRLSGSLDMTADGERVIFESGEGNAGDIYLVDWKKNSIWNLSKRDLNQYGDPDAIFAEDTEGTMSDDGTVIVWQSRPRWDVDGIKIVDFRSKRTFLLSERGENKTKPVVARDGDSVVFMRDGRQPTVVDLKRLREN
jgi:Tol biopolymer transport system component